MFVVLLSKILINDRRLRYAARFFYWLKWRKQAVNVFDLGDLEGCPFTRYEQREYLKILMEQGWITQRKDGIYCLQGRPFFHRMLNLSKQTQYCQIPDSSLNDKRAWNQFISACAVTSVGRTINLKAKRKDKLRHMACSNLAGITSAAIPLALSLLSSFTGLSQSSAHRLRQSAAASGLVQVERQRQVVTQCVNDVWRSVRMSHNEFLQFVDGDQGAYKLSKGILYEDFPSLVTVMRTKKVKI